MNKRNIILIFVPIILIIALIIYSMNDSNVKRTSDEQEEVAETTEDTATTADQDQFVSRLKNQSKENLETLSAKLTTLKTQTLMESNSASTREVKLGDTVVVNYRGWLASNGKIFDESFIRGDDGFEFTVGYGVIEGWSEGVQGMKIGEVRRIYIPSELGYGSYGAGSDIPANADLIFDVELISFTR